MKRKLSKISDTSPTGSMGARMSSAHYTTLDCSVARALHNQQQGALQKSLRWMSAACESHHPVPHQNEHAAKMCSLEWRAKANPTKSCVTKSFVPANSKNAMQQDWKAGEPPFHPSAPSTQKAMKLFAVRSNAIRQSWQEHAVKAFWLKTRGVIEES